MVLKNCNPENPSCKNCKKNELFSLSNCFIYELSQNGTGLLYIPNMALAQRLADKIYRLLQPYKTKESVNKMAEETKPEEKKEEEKKEEPKKEEEEAPKEEKKEEGTKAEPVK